MVDDLIVLGIAILSSVAIIATDQIRMRRERIIVCMAIADALEACPESNKQAANCLALDVARRLNEKGWKIDL